MPARLPSATLSFVLVLAACASAEAERKPEAVASAPAATQPAPAAEERPMTAQPAPAAAQGAVNPAAAVAALVAKHGEPQRARIERGVKQVADYWRAEDGDAKAFEEFVTASYVGDDKLRDQLFERFQTIFEQLDGHFLEIGRALRSYAELERGPLLPIDHDFAAFDPSAHVGEDLFKSKLAFHVLLNFPLRNLKELTEQGKTLSRRDWAEARLALRFALRPSGEALQARAKASAAADAYIAGYNIWMHHVVRMPSPAAPARAPGDPARSGAADGERVFEKGVRLITHWNLRDQIKADYSLPDKKASLARQRAIRAVMERIATQTIPKAVIDDPRVDWDPVANTVKLAPAAEVEDMKQGTRAAQPSTSTDREPDTRYAMLLETFKAARRLDADSPLAPTEIDRRFQLDRELPEERVRAMLEEVLASPAIPRLAKVIEKRLGRKLEPHDVWYNGFLERPEEQKLSGETRQRYPNADAFKKDIPRILRELGFPEQDIPFLDRWILVDPARGAGHAMQAARRGDETHLRTRINPDGMDYKGYNIAVHELGHNVEQVYGLYRVDHTLLQGVPGTAFTEALAFTFQNRDLELLGRKTEDAARSERYRALNELWATWEISGVALVDLGIWKWMYAHPDATPAQVREEVLRLARDLWNRYYAPVLGGKDSPLLAIYSHMVSSFLYLPDYPLGHLIAVQLEEKLKGPAHGKEFARVASFGRVTPDLWMEHATGRPVSADALLRAGERALAEEEKQPNRGVAPLR